MRKPGPARTMSPAKKRPPIRITLAITLGRLVSCVVPVQLLSKGKIVFQSIIREFRRFPCAFAAPKRIGLKSHIRLSGVLIKSSLISSSDVST
jgi:hypothetical protein